MNYIKTMVCIAFGPSVPCQSSRLALRGSLKINNLRFDRESKCFGSETGAFLQHRAIMMVGINIVHIVIIGRPYACIRQAGKHFLRSNTWNNDFIRSKIVCKAGLKRYLPVVPKETH